MKFIEVESSAIKIIKNIDNVFIRNYYDAIKTKPPSQIQSIDMGRRSIHNEGSQKIIERLKEKVDLDDDTSRRIFTLICVLKL